MTPSGSPASHHPAAGRNRASPPTAAADPRSSMHEPVNMGPRGRAGGPDPPERAVLGLRQKQQGQGQPGGHRDGAIPSGHEVCPPKARAPGPTGTSAPCPALPPCHRALQLHGASTTFPCFCVLDASLLSGRYIELLSRTHMKCMKCYRTINTFKRWGCSMSAK